MPWANSVLVKLLLDEFIQSELNAWRGNPGDAWEDSSPYAKSEYISVKEMFVQQECSTKGRKNKKRKIDAYYGPTILNERLKRIYENVKEKVGADMVTFAQCMALYVLSPLVVSQSSNAEHPAFCSKVACHKLLTIKIFFVMGCYSMMSEGQSCNSNSRKKHKNLATWLTGKRGKGPHWVHVQGAGKCAMVVHLFLFVETMMEAGIVTECIVGYPAKRTKIMDEPEMGADADADDDDGDNNCEMEGGYTHLVWQKLGLTV